MAMMRLHTKQSDGKANLHQGALGVGITLNEGKAIAACQFHRYIDSHPDTEASINELIVPRWKEALFIATRCYEMSKLGYLGVDIVLDVNAGPVVLELNARPGLSIQIANKTGMAERIQKVDSFQHDPLPSVRDRIEKASSVFP